MTLLGGRGKQAEKEKEHLLAVLSVKCWNHFELCPFVGRIICSFLRIDLTQFFLATSWLPLDCCHWIRLTPFEFRAKGFRRSCLQKLNVLVQEPRVWKACSCCFSHVVIKSHFGFQCDKLEKAAAQDYRQRRGNFNLSLLQPRCRVLRAGWGQEF